MDAFRASFRTKAAVPTFIALPTAVIVRIRGASICPILDRWRAVTPTEQPRHLRCQHFVNTV